MLRTTLRSLLLSVLVLGASAAGQAPRQTTPARDTPAQLRDAAPEAPSSRIAGRVTASDSGRPVGGARVMLNSPELTRGAAALTSDDGTFEFSGLPAGRYTVGVSRPGFISLSWGQRRPLQPGTPIQLGEGQSLTGIDFRMLRGSVITGRIHDQNGEPMPSTMVRVMRYQYVQGQRQLVPAGSGQTDDRGQYRVWGLNPGDYFVTAVAPPLDGDRGTPPPTGAVALGRGGRGGSFQVVEAPVVAAPLTYAPTFYPGVVSAAEAQPVTVGLGAEMSGVDFNLLRVQTSTVSGRVIGVDGRPAAGGTVMLIAEGQPVRGGGPGSGYDGRIQNDGAFAIPGVPPGRYLLRAFTGGGRGRGNGQPDGSASQSLAVNGDMSLQLALAPGATVTGTLTPEGSGSWPDMSQFRVSIVSLDGPSPGGMPSVRVASTGHFAVENIPAGAHMVRVQGPRGWILDSVRMGNRDVVDTPISIRSGEALNDLAVVVTDSVAEVAGQVADQFGTPVPDFTVLAFPLDASLWTPQSRHIMTTRPDQTGRYQLRELPAGEYYLAVIDPLEPGEWFEPAFLERQRLSATRVTIRPGDVRVQDFRIAGQ